MKKVAALFFASFIILTALTSCKNEGTSVSCRQILDAMTACEVGLPAGKVYDRSAAEGEDEYLTESLIAALFPSDGTAEIVDGWLDCAFFFSLGEHPCEFAVIYCKDSDTALDTARLLSAHLDSVKLLKSNGSYTSYLDNASVTVMGNYALLIISSDAANALREAKKVI